MRQPSDRVQPFGDIQGATAASPLGAESHPARLLDTPGAWYTLTLLTLSYALAYVDRQLLNLVVDPIKRTMLLTDTQFSFVQGLAFISAYLMAAPFFGRLVDITSRRTILLTGVCLWSIFTVLCGLATTYWQLAAARFMVGISEACVFPVALSIIPELFSTRRAPRALSIFTLGGQLGGGFSLVAGGAIIGTAATIVSTVPLFSTLESWQLAFVLVGVPGLAFAALLLTVREPERHRSSSGERAILTTRQSFAMIWQRRSFYARIYLFTGMNGVVFLGVPAWYPSFLIRVHHMPVAEVGVKVGIITLIFGSVGTLSGPVAAGFFKRRGREDAPLRAAAWAAVGTFLACALIPYSTGPTMALALVAGITFFCGFPVGIIAFAMQRATAPGIRGIVASLYTLSAQLIGYGIGPTAIALTTDRLFGDPLKVGHSLQLVCCFAAAMVILALVTNFANYRTAIKDPSLPQD